MSNGILYVNHEDKLGDVHCYIDKDSKISSICSTGIFFPVDQTDMWV
jgi:hypothetical protein